MEGGTFNIASAGMTLHNSLLFTFRSLLLQGIDANIVRPLFCFSSLNANEILLRLDNRISVIGLCNSSSQVLLKTVLKYGTNMHLYTLRS